MQSGIGISPSAELFERRFRALQQDYSAVARENATLKRRAVELQGASRQTQQLHQRNATLEAEKHELQAKFHEVFLRLEQAAKAAQFWEARCREVDNEAKELRHAAEAREPAFLQTSRELYSAGQEKRRVEIELEKLRAEISRESQRAQVAVSELTVCKRQLQEARVELSALRESRDQVSVGSDRLQMAFSFKEKQLRACIVEFAKERQEFQNQITVLKAELRGNSVNLRDSQERLATDRKDIVTLNEQLSLYIKRHEKDKIEIAALTAQRIKSDQKLRAQQEITHALQEDCRVLTSQLDERQRQIREEEDLRARLTERLKEANDILHAEQIKVVALREKIDGLKAAEAEANLEKDKLVDLHKVRRCTRCSQQFTNATNSGNDCRYHTGRLEKRTKPLKGFAWTCCKKVGKKALPCCFGGKHTDLEECRVTIDSGRTEQK